MKDSPPPEPKMKYDQFYLRFRHIVRALRFALHLSSQDEKVKHWNDRRMVLFYTPGWIVPVLTEENSALWYIQLTQTLVRLFPVVVHQ